MRTHIPDRPSRHGRLGSGYLSRYKNELDMDEPEEETMGRPDSLTGELASTETVGHHDATHLTSLTDVHKTDPSLEINENPTVESEFNSTPEALSPINLDSALVTDSYQQQDAPEADLIGAQTKQGADAYQTQDSQCIVLA